jgi:hypothetical protein
LSPNVILGLVAFVSMGNVFQKWKEKVYEEIVTCPSRDLTKPIVSVPKNKKIKKSNKKLIGFTKIDEL